MDAEMKALRAKYKALSKAFSWNGLQDCRAKITGGENAGYTCVVQGMIPKRYNKEEDRYRVRLEGNFASSGAALTTVNGRFLERI